jgi:hypothetical protein
MKLICRLLVVSLLFLSFQSSAGMIGTDQVATAGAVSAERLHVQSLLSRSDIANTLQSMGVDPKMAVDRVAALTDDEVRTLSGKLDAMPAGGTSGWAVAAIIIVVAFIIWWLWYRK